MKRTYNLNYEQGKYYLEYSMPGNDEGQLVIEEKTMELDSVKLYKMFFERVTERIDITIINKIDENIDEQIRKKGARVCETLQLLCNDICHEINEKCFN